MKSVFTAVALMSIALVGGLQAPLAANAAPTPPRAMSIAQAVGVADYLMTQAQRESAGEELVAKNLTRINTALEVIADMQLNSGYAGLVVNPATATVHLWWAGPLPAVVSALVEGQSEGIQVVLHRAAHSLTELRERIEASESRRQTTVFVAPKVDGSGVVAVLRTGESSTAELMADIGVPVTPLSADTFVQTSGNRQNDGDPWWGGSMMMRSTAPGDASICSTGFAVLDGPYGRLLSAAHCDVSGNLAWRDGTNSDTLTSGYGSVWSSPAADSLIMDPVGGTQGRIFVGGHSSSTYRKVAGSAANWPGDAVCTSGANSGERCSGLVITNDAYSWNCNGYACTTILATSSKGDQVVAGGDSGGPVYARRADGRATARGIILGSLISASVPCADVQYTTSCYSLVVYYPIRPLLTLWGVSLEIES